MNLNSSNNLLASIAVFGELCDTAGDIKNIIIKFIKSTYAYEKKWSMDSVEVTQLLKKHFDFDIPEAVIKTCLINLKNTGFLDRRDGKFSVIDPSYNIEEFTDVFNEKKSNYENISAGLIAYYGKTLEGKIQEINKTELINNFNSFLLDQAVSDKYLTIISSYVIEESRDPDFKELLNQIKEGLVLVAGLRYTDDLVSIGRWTDELSIYLDTEHLFNSVGYNGEVYKRLFDDFFGLVNEINQASIQKNNKRLVYLKYFQSTKEEYERFFYVAKKIIQREDNLSPENDAMEEICKGCVTPSDILRKQSEFETKLKILGINIQEELDFYSQSQFNVEDQTLIIKYQDKNSEESIVNVLKQFTKINYLRKGVNRTNFEKCKHIILTGKTLTQLLSKDLEIKTEAKDIPFATDIYFLTNRIWFRLNKGLSKSQTIFATLDIVTKAQIVLSSQISKSVSKKYQQLRTDLENGTLTKDQAQEYHYVLRESAKKPEEITVGNLTESVEFILENDFDRHIREKSALMEKVKQGEQAIRELNKRNIETRLKSKAKTKNFIKGTHFVLTSIFVLFTASIPFLVGFFINYYRTNADSPLSIIGLIISLIVEIPLLYIFYKKYLNKWYKRKITNYYLLRISRS